jgi:hypothetical protein
MISRVGALREIVDDYIATTIALMFPASGLSRMIDFIKPPNADEAYVWANWTRAKPHDDGHLWRNSMGKDLALERRAKLVWIVSATSPEQYRAVILMRMPLARSEWSDQQTSYYERLTTIVASRPDEERVKGKGGKKGQYEAAQPQWDSELQMRTALPPEAYTGLIVVRGSRLVYPTREQVAIKMGLIKPDGSANIRYVSFLLARGYEAMARRVEEGGDNA